MKTLDALDRWLVAYGPTFSRGYEATARGLIECHIAAALGEVELADLERAHAVELVGVMAAKGLSASTARGALSILRRVVGLEIEAGRRARNPFANLAALLRGLDRRSGRAVAVVDAYTAAELSTLLGVAHRRRPWLYPLLVFLAATGARRGEALGLLCDDVDLARRVVQIRRARVRGRATTPKSGRARVVPLDAAGGLALEVLAERLEGRSAGELVFVGAEGGTLDERNVARAFEAVRVEAERFGVPRRRLHDLRHTFASHALEAGVSIQRVAAWLGHANPETTWRVYAHLIERDQVGRWAPFLDVRPRIGPFRVEPGAASRGRAPRCA